MNTQTNSQTTTDYEIPKSQFVEMLHLDGAREYTRDFDRDVRLEYLKKEIAKRVCSNDSEINANAVPNHFVVQQAAERYFSLVTSATRSLHFSQPEMTIILNTTCSPFWQ